MTTSSLRQSAVARPSAFVKTSTFAVLRPAHAAAFSTTVSRKASAEAETDEELSAKLESEIQIEEDMKASEQQPASIKDFLENSPFELVDTAGQEVVKLTRSYGDEKYVKHSETFCFTFVNTLLTHTAFRITVSFSIADITNYDPYSEDAALEDEELSDESLDRSGKQSGKAEEDVDEMDEDLDEESAPINLSIVIEKPGKTAGALNIDATAQDGNIVVENMFFYEDAKVAKIDSPESAQKRADVYPGPPFGSLDEDLQVLMERFLEERGITSAMAVFVPDYVDVKEQKEYLRWLSNVKTFVDA